MPQESNKTKLTRLMNGVAAGTSAQTSSILDTAGFQGAQLAVAFGTITAGAATSVKVQDGNASNLSDAADVAGSGITIADTDDNTVAIIDLYRPVKRYLQVVISRGTQNAVIDGVFGLLYEGRNYPEAKDATVSHQTLLVSPADGTP